MTEKSGWLKEQFEAVEKEVKEWPGWLKRLTGIKGLRNTDMICSDFLKQCEIFAKKLVAEAGISSPKAEQVKEEIIRHLSYSVTAIENSLLNQEEIPAYEDIPRPKNPYRPGPLIVKPDFKYPKTIK